MIGEGLGGKHRHQAVRAHPGPDEAIEMRREAPVRVVVAEPIDRDEEHWMWGAVRGIDRGSRAWVFVAATGEERTGGEQSPDPRHRGPKAAGERSVQRRGAGFQGEGRQLSE